MSTGPKTADGKARIAAAQLRHGRFVDWRKKREKEKYYYAEIDRLMGMAEDAGLLPD